MLPLVLTLTLSAGDLVGGQGVHHEEHYEPSPYRYEYNVHDDKVYLDFRAEEEGDGQDNVHGFYHVQLPDGRLQKVTYTVNSDSGYVADVTYDGEAVHPAYHAGGGHDDGHQFGKSLVLETFQRRPQTTLIRDRIGTSLDQTQEKLNFSGFIGSSSRRSNSVPSGIESLQRSPTTSIESDRKSFLLDPFQSPSTTVEISRVSLDQEPFQKRLPTAVENDQFGKSLTQESFQRTPTGTIERDGSELSLTQESFQQRPPTTVENSRSGKTFVQESFQKSPISVAESDGLSVSLGQEPFKKMPATAVENNKSEKSLPQESFQRQPTETVGSDISGISLNQEPLQKKSQNNERNDTSEKSLFQEPFQISPKTAEESDILETPLDGKKEENISSGGLFGSPSQHSNSLPTDVEKPIESTSETNMNNFLDPSELEELEKEVFKRDDENKVSEPKYFAANDMKTFQPKQTSLLGNKIHFTYKEKQEESELSTVSPLEEFLKTFKPRSSAFLKLKAKKNKSKKFVSENKFGKKKFSSFEPVPSKSIFESSTHSSDPRETSVLSSSSRKTISEFLKNFEPKSSKLIQLKNSQNKAPNVSSGSKFESFQNSPPAFHSSFNSSIHPKPGSRSSKNLKTSTNKKQQSSLIVHRRLPTQ